VTMEDTDVLARTAANRRLLADWTWGSGAEVSGPNEALAMATSGRPAALDDLSEPGVRILRSRIAR
jgi:hypothetical protein